jgi:hypothetical protein
MWKVLAIATSGGRLARFGIERVSELRQLVEIDVKAPDIAVRDRLQEHQIRREENEAGILSLQTWAEEAGRDYQQETRLGARRQQATQPAGAGFASDLPPAAGEGKDVQDVTLNGAQITAAKDVLLGVSGGTTPVVVAVELLVALGIPRDRAQTMSNAAAQIKVPSAATLESVRSLMWEGYP